MDGPRGTVHSTMDGPRGTVHSTMDGPGGPSAVAMDGPGGPIIGGTIRCVTDPVLLTLCCCLTAIYNRSHSVLQSSSLKQCRYPIGCRLHVYLLWLVHV